MRFLLMLACLAVVGCAPDDQAYNAEALNDFDRHLLQDAMDAWNEAEPEHASLSIDPHGGSIAIYADHFPYLAWWQPRDDGTSEISVPHSITMYIRDGCHSGLWRHELGHALGYSHGEHKWLAHAAC